MNPHILHVVSSLSKKVRFLFTFHSWKLPRTNSGFEPDSSILWRKAGPLQRESIIGWWTFLADEQWRGRLHPLRQRPRQSERCSRIRKNEEKRKKQHQRFFAHVSGKKLNQNYHDLSQSSTKFHRRTNTKAGLTFSFKIRIWDWITRKMMHTGEKIKGEKTLYHWLGNKTAG